MQHIDTHKGLIAWFARNSVAANLLMWILIFSGMFAAFTIKKQFFPNVELNTITIRVPYLGAAPQEVEDGVLLKIEEALKNLEGIKNIRGTAREGSAVVSIEVDEEYDALEVMDEVKVQVDAIPRLPENTEKPVIYRQKWTQTVLWITIAGDTSERMLKEISKDLRNKLATLPEVSNVRVVGSRPYEISVEVSEAQLQQYGLTFSDVVNAIRRSSIDMPGGAIRSKEGDILLRANGQAYTGQEFAEVVLISREDGTRLTLGDIARINDGFVENNMLALFDGKPAVSIQVNAVGDQSVLEISKSVNAYLDDWKKDLPEGILVDAWGDSSFYLADRLNLMLGNMGFGALLVFLVLSLFLKLRLAFWVIVGLPVCFLGSLAVLPMEYIGVSINMISLFGFILVLGIVVDDAIIMGESAYSEIDAKGQSVDNVIRGVKRVAMPATFGVLTTIAAFFPLILSTGGMSMLWKSIAWVVIICLIFSLIESKLILPAHLAHMKDRPYDPAKANKLQRFRDTFSEGIKGFIKQHYSPFLLKCIRNRYVTVASFLAALILSIGLVRGGMLSLVLMPDVPTDFINTQLELQPGATIEQRDRAIRRVIAALEQVEADIVKEIGEKSVHHYMGFAQGTVRGMVFAELTKGEARSIDSFAIQDRWREAIGEIPGIKNLTVGGDGFGGGPDFGLQFRGSKLEDLRAVVDEVKTFLLSYEGITEINDSFSGGSDEIRLNIRPEAEALGLTLDSLARQVRYGFYGAEAQRIQRGDEEVRVLVRYPRHERDSIGNLENMRIRTPAGNEVPFSEVASIEMGQGYGSIMRLNGERAITISGNVNKDLTDPMEVISDFEKNFLDDLLAKYPTVEYGLEGQSKEQSDALMSLLQGFLLALFLIYTLMAIPLKSYVQPLMIMSVIPFGFVGAAVGHILLGHDVSFFSICGLIALAGVVVNDSLIMVDYVNRGRQEGMSLLQSVTQAGAARFRAIVLTSLTTFMGLLPIVFERSLQAQAVIPMAISLAFGILFATVITLLLIPCLYVILDDIRNLFTQRRHKMVPPSAEEQGA